MQKDNDSGSPSTTSGLTGRLRRRRGSNEVNIFFEAILCIMQLCYSMLFSNIEDWPSGVF